MLKAHELGKIYTSETLNFFSNFFPFNVAGLFFHRSSFCKILKQVYGQPSAINIENNRSTKCCVSTVTIFLIGFPSLKLLTKLVNVDPRTKPSFEYYILMH